jgi:AcrR family transcriptional regulator
MMADEILTPERILTVTEDVLRRFGPAKATVVDVARVLGVSHGSVYRHFPSKAALRDAVTERWLARVMEPLTTIMNEDSPAPARLRRWLDTLIAFKHRNASDDPEMFATYASLVADTKGDVVSVHINQLIEQITRIITDGVTRGEISVADPIAAGKAVFSATSRFHDPVHAPEWSNPDIDANFEAVWSLILYGLGLHDTSKAV